jgi:hypothetical protein
MISAPKTRFASRAPARPFVIRRTARLGRVPTLRGLIGVGVLSGAAAVPIGCGKFKDCEASRTCPSSMGGSMSTAGKGGNENGEGGAGTSDSGGTSGENAMGSDDGSLVPEDTTAPRIISVSPANGETGVRGDVKLVVRFSEPMDRASTQAAYQSADILADSVSFAWSEDRTELTIHPALGLAYAEGTTPGAERRSYAVTFTDVAKDAAGTTLANTFSWSFATLRRITHTIAVPFEKVHRIGDEGSVIACAGSGTADLLSVGHIDSSTLGYVDTQGLVSVSIGALPAKVEEFQAAILSGSVQSSGDQTVLVEHVTIVPPTSASFSGPALSPLGTFSGSVDVLAALTDDYENRGFRNDLSQYRLRLSTYPDADNESFVSYGCASFALTTTYLLD